MAQETPSQIGRYRILGVVGQWTAGSLQIGGWLYRGHDDVTDRDVWIKTLSPTAADLGPGHPSMDEARARFHQEARVIARLDHPNIIGIRELGEHEGMPFMALEGLEGKSLLEIMNTGMSLKTGLAVLLLVLDVLAKMHRSGIIHRDIKPSCIFECADGRVKVIDLFFAKLMDPNRSVAAGGLVMGTPSYMSPEQVRGDALDGRSDFFSLGCVLYEMIAGRQPFQGDNIFAVWLELTQQNPDMGLIPDGPEWKGLRSVITRSLQKKAEDRYPDAGAMRVDLELALKGLGPSADWKPPRSGSLTPQPA